MKSFRDTGQSWLHCERVRFKIKDAKLSGIQRERSLFESEFDAHKDANDLYGVEWAGENNPPPDHLLPQHCI